jgi:hypothetical protein
MARQAGIDEKNRGGWCRPEKDTCSTRTTQPRQTSTQVALAIEPADLCTVFGVTDPDVATRLLSQLLAVLHPDTSQPVDQALINLALP